MAAVGKKDDLQDARIPKFDVINYHTWIEQIRAECVLRPGASKVLAKESLNPIEKFQLIYPAEYDLIAPGCK